MAPEEESKPEATASESTPLQAGGRRDRRPARGRRGRGRGRRPKPGPNPLIAEQPDAPLAPPEPEAVFELAAEEGPSAQPEAAETTAPEDVAEEVVEPLTAAPEPALPARPAPPATVQEAIDQVSNIVEALRSSLDDMEEVLELLELFERQKNTDEREIDSLRRALRQMHRPRDPGQHRSHR